MIKEEFIIELDKLQPMSWEHMKNYNGLSKEEVLEELDNYINKVPNDYDYDGTIKMYTLDWFVDITTASVVEEWWKQKYNVSEIVKHVLILDTEEKIRLMFSLYDSNFIGIILE